VTGHSRHGINDKRTVRDGYVPKNKKRNGTAFIYRTRILYNQKREASFSDFFSDSRLCPITQDSSKERSSSNESRTLQWAAVGDRFSSFLPSSLPPFARCSLRTPPRSFALYFLLKGVIKNKKCELQEELHRHQRHRYKNKKGESLFWPKMAPKRIVGYLRSWHRLR